MKSARLFRAGVLAAALLGAGVTTAVFATQESDGPATRPEAKRRLPGGQVVRPFNLLGDLDVGQEAQLKELRQEFLLARRELEDKWMADSMAVLSDAQRAELEELQAARDAEAAAQRAQRRRERQSEESEGSEDSGDSEDGDSGADE